MVREDLLVTSTHDQQTLRVGKDGLGQELEGSILLEDSGNLAWKLVKTSNDLVAALSERNAIFGELESHHQQGDVLGGVSLNREASASSKTRKHIINRPWWKQHRLQDQR